MAKGDVTVLLASAAAGDRQAVDALMPLVYEELRMLAASQMAQERVGHTLGTTGLIHEAYMRLTSQQNLDLRSRGMFFGIAANTMRRILVDHARGRNRLKRGGGEHPVPLSTAIEWAADESNTRSAIDVIELDAALQELAQLNERCARLVELRFFIGLSVDDAAEAVGVSPRQAANDWKVARAFLAGRLLGI